MGAARNPNAMFANREHTAQRAAQKAANGHRNAKPGRARYGSPAFLQRHLGNRRFQQLTAPGRPVLQRACACGGTCAHCSGHDDEARVQTKLTVGPPNDRYEQEADHVADQVMRMPEPQVQRQAAVEEEPDEDMLQTKPLAAQITPLVQRKAGTQQGTPAPFSVDDMPRSSGRSLGAATRSFMEPRFGVDFGGVRLHTGAGAERAAAQLQARAFTYGQDIWLGRGASESDRRLMAHELTHVVQQGAVHQGAARTQKVQRAETDTSGNCAPLQDAKSDVNTHVNSALSTARSHAGTPPTPRIVIDKVEEILATNTSVGRSAIEDWASTLPSTKVNLPGQASTKFAGVSYRIWSQTSFPILNPTMKVNDICIGSDKLGHFFQQGHDYFEIARRRSGGTVAQAEEFGERTEGGGFGLVTTGVFSNADLEANRQGLQFYDDLAANPRMTFDIANYISSDWNEESNPSFYEQSVAEQVWSNLLTNTWTGTWDVGGTSSTAITVTITKKGSSFVGSYTYQEASGPPVSGKLRNINITYGTQSVRGTNPIIGHTTHTPVSSVEISFEWSQGSQSGRGKWVSSDESHLAGTWGTGSSDNNGGTWNIAR